MDNELEEKHKKMLGVYSLTGFARECDTLSHSFNGTFAFKISFYHRYIVRDHRLKNDRESVYFSMNWLL